MKPLHRTWILAAVGLALIWAAVAVVVHITEDHISSPSKVLDLMRSSPWLDGAAGTSSAASGRTAHVERVIANVNMLDFPQRTEMRDEGAETIRKFFDSLTPEERKVYVDRTVQKAFDAVIKGFKAMAPEERKNVVTRVRRDIRANRNGDEAQKKAEDDQKLFDDFIDIGIEDYLKNASTEEKMKLAPAIEDMQTRIRGIGR